MAHSIVMKAGELSAGVLAEQLAQQQVTANKTVQKQLELRISSFISKLDHTSTQDLLACLDIERIEINSLKQVTGLFI